MALARLLVVVLVLVPMLTYASCPGVTTQVTPFAAESLTVGAVAQPLTASIYKPSGVTPSLALVSVEAAPIRYHVVGMPSASSGHTVLAPTTFTICGLDTIAAFRAISLGGDAVLTITYYRPK